MRPLLFLPIAALCTVFATEVSAQDGLYGSFIAGQKFVDMKPLNDKLKEPGVLGGNIDEFGGNYWMFGGEGHAILAKHFVVGGKGTACFKEHKVTNPLDPALDERVKITMGMGLVTLGYAFLGGREKQMHLYPQLGVGGTTFLLQHKFAIPDTSKFNDVFNNDGQSVMQKIGLAVDGALGFDYYIDVIELKRIIPGLNFGPLIHAEAGYTFVGKNIKWMRDVKPIAEFNPDLSFKGFYFNLGIGLGLSSAQSSD